MTILLIGVSIIVLCYVYSLYEDSSNYKKLLSEIRRISKWKNVKLDSALLYTEKSIYAIAELERKRQILEGHIIELKQTEENLNTKVCHLMHSYDEELYKIEYDLPNIYAKKNSELQKQLTINKKILDEEYQKRKSEIQTRHNIEKINLDAEFRKYKSEIEREPKSLSREYSIYA